MEFHTLVIQDAGADAEGKRGNQQSKSAGGKKFIALNVQSHGKSFLDCADDPLKDP